MGRNKTGTELSGNRVRDGVSMAPSLDLAEENLERSQEGKGGMVRDRFDLEQDLLECWKVVNDIEMYIEQGAEAKDFQLLAQYYERKFQRLWDTFENLIRENKL